MKAVVIGGTGQVGSRVVNRLRALGHEAVPASPSRGVNSVTGEGLARALDGAHVVIDVVEARAADMDRVEADFVRSASNLAK